MIVPRSRGNIRRSADKFHDESQIEHVGDPLVVRGLHLFDWREDAHHRIVDPDVDGPELFLDLVGCALDSVGVGDIGGNETWCA